jgi:hypothetical protein
MDLLYDSIRTRQKNNTKKKMPFRSMACHPKQLTSKKRVFKNSCLDKATLQTMKHIWNRRYPDNIIVSSKPETIWKKMKQNMQHSCSNEMCWVDNTFQKSSSKIKLKHQLFAPRTPKSWKQNPNEWLSSIEISDVMKQYEDTYNHFKFFGPSPIDFETLEYKDICVWPEICNINLEKLKKQKKTNLGFIFNTDKHYQNGSHWIAMYVDLDKGKLFFFDSNGTEEPKEIKDFIQKLSTQCKLKCNMNLHIDHNHPFTHQRKDGQCGMYCLYFIVSLLKKKHNLNYFKSKRIPDKKVQNLRDIYFNNI